MQMAKNYSAWLSGLSQILAIGALLLAPATNIAHAQSSSPSSVTQDEVKVMRQQIQALVARVKELEKKADKVSSNPEEDKQSKAIERRLRTLEHKEFVGAHYPLSDRECGSIVRADWRRYQKSGHYVTKSGGKPDQPQVLTVKAPFIVVDGKNKELMRVGEWEYGHNRGIYVNDQNGDVVAHMGEIGGSGDGRVYVQKSNSATPTAEMAETTSGPVIALEEQGKLEVMLDKETLAFYDDNKTQLSRFGTRNRKKGFLTLNENGEMMIEAGVLNDHKGYVLARPERPSMDPHGDPSVLKGAGK
jgi:hypothetical protein